MARLARSSVPAANPEKEKAIRHMQAWGYYPTWMQDSWKKIQPGIWNRVILFELPVEADGQVAIASDWYREWKPLNHAVHKGESKLDLAFTMTDADKFERLFTREQAYRKLTEWIIKTCNLAGIDGVHLDFEMYGALTDSAVAGFRAFVARLSKRMRGLPKETVFSVFFPVGAERELFDGKTLAHVDYLVLQGYDAHWAESAAAGPVAPLRGPHPLSWENTLQQVLALGVERRKILFSIPYFGYEWPTASNQPGAATTGRGDILSYAPVEPRVLPRIRIAATERIKCNPVKRDPDSGSPYYVYRNPEGNWRQGWFEDESSLSEKLDFVIREKLCGIAAFPLGYDDGHFDALLVKKLKNS